MQRENGWMSYLMFYGPIAQYQEDPRVRPLFPWPMVLRQSFLQKQGSQLWGPLGDGNEQSLAHSLDLAEELKEVAVVKLAQYQQNFRQGFEKKVKVKVKALILGDLVLRKVVGTARNPSWGKLGPNWEGLYWVTSVTGVGAYMLGYFDGLVVPHPCNVNILRKYYF